MKVYYTTSINTGEGPVSNSDSIGGYVSNQPVPNDEVGNIFGEITLNSAQQGKTEYRAIVLENDEISDIQNVQLYVTTAVEAPQGEIRIAPVVMSKDGDGRDVMERIANIYSKPYVGDFQATDSENKLNIGTLTAGQKIGVWLQRKLVITNIKQEYDKVCEPLEYRPYWFKPVEKETTESWQLNVEWD